MKQPPTREIDKRDRQAKLAWLIAECSAMKGRCIRSPLRVLYEDLVGNRQSHQAGVATGRKSSEFLREDLHDLALAGIIQRGPGRVFVTDWEKLYQLAAAA